jgi:hypothetical protein
LLRCLVGVAIKGAASDNSCTFKLAGSMREVIAWPEATFRASEKSWI